MPPCRARLTRRVTVPRNKGNPRCELCEGRGIMRVHNGYRECRCVAGKPNNAMLRQLAALELPDFATYDDEWRQSRGLPPYTGDAA